MQQASTKPPGEWGEDDMSSGDDETPEERKEHKRQFTEWRKKHYNEFYAVKRAKELMQQVNHCVLVTHVINLWTCAFPRMRRNSGN